MILALLFNLSGLYFFVRFAHKQIRREVHEYVVSLSDNNLLRFDKSFIKEKEKEGKLSFVKPDEFRYEDKLYDVVRTSPDDPNVLLVFEDNREGNFLKAVLGNRANDLKDYWLSVYQLIIKDVLPNTHSNDNFATESRIFFQETTEQLVVPFRKNFYISPHLSRLTPPPDAQLNFL
jgi:hypothetical protein